MLSSIDARGNRTSFAYDAAGREALRIDARGNRTTYMHDAAGRLTRQRYERYRPA